MDACCKKKKKKPKNLIVREICHVESKGVVEIHMQKCTQMVCVCAQGGSSARPQLSKHQNTKVERDN